MNAARNGFRARTAVAVALALALAVALVGFAGCKKEETPSVTLTVACTDEVRQSLADANVTDAEAFLSAAAEKFAAQYTDIDVTINVVSVAAGWADRATLVAKTVDAIFAAGVPAGTAPATPAATVPDPAPAEDGDDGASDEDDGFFLDLGESGQVAYADEEADSSGDDEGEGEEDAVGEGDAAAEGDTDTDAGDEAGADDGAISDAMVDPDPDVDTGIVPSASPETTITAAESVTMLTPDVLFGTYDDLAQAVYSGLAVPLDDIITVDMRTYIPDSLLHAGMTPANGNTYLLPFSFSEHVLIIDADLFAACGLGFYATQIGTNAVSSSSSEEGEEEEEEPVELDLAESKDALAADAYSRAVLHTWTPAEWTYVLKTLNDQLPKVAQRRFRAAVASWSEASEMATAAIIDADVAYENARIAEDDEAMAAAQHDAEVAQAELDALGSRPELEALYPMMMMGSGDEGVEYAAALMRLFGSPFFDEDGYVMMEDEEGITAARWLEWLSNQGVFPGNASELSYEDCLQLFSEGRLAMMMVDSSDVYDLFLDTIEYTEVYSQVEEDEEGGSSTSELVNSGYRQTRNYAFVAIPSWSVDMFDSILQLWEAGADDDALAELGEDVDALRDESAQIIPVTIRGFAVLDNGDELTTRLAKEFVKYVLNSDAWLSYEACQGQLPADTIIYDTFISDLLFGNDMRSKSASIMNVSGNVPGWNAAQEALVSAFASAADGSRTPVEVTAAIDKGMNAAIEPAWRAAKLHE